MSKILFTVLALSISIFGADIPISKVKLHSFSKSVALNAKVVQLENAQQSITSLVSGHLEKYYVKPAQSVKKGQKIALIESIIVSKMSANYLSLKKQLEATSKNYEAVKNLYDRGMTSLQELNNQSIKRSEISAKLNSLYSQLETLGINASSLTKATANFILYAHSGGIVAALLKPLHSSITINDLVVSIIKEQAYYIESYLPIEYATKVSIGDKIVVDYNDKKIITHITQIMPKLDAITQRVVILSSVNEKEEHLFIDSYVKSTLYFGKVFTYKAIKKTALSFFNNEWVVFTPKSNVQDSYDIKAIKIITQDEGYIAVDGLKLGEKYVSAKSYYVKSALLKSSLGDGD